MAKDAKFYVKTGANTSEVFYPITKAANVTINNKDGGVSNVDTELTSVRNTVISLANISTVQLKGVVNSESDISSASYRKGWQYVVKTAGTYFGNVCEVGDWIYCVADKAGSAKNSDFEVIQGNINLDFSNVLVKPASSSDGNIAVFNSTGALTAVSKTDAHYTPDTTSATAAFKKVATDALGHVTATAAVTKSDIVSLIGTANAAEGDDTGDDGLMSAEDKTKLDGLPSVGITHISGSNASASLVSNMIAMSSSNGKIAFVDIDQAGLYTAGGYPGAIKIQSGLVTPSNTAMVTITHAKNFDSSISAGLYKTAYDKGGHVTSATAVEKSDLTTIIGGATATVNSVAGVDGLMSSDDKTKLDGLPSITLSHISAGNSLSAAENNIVDMTDTNGTVVFLDTDSEGLYSEGGYSGAIKLGSVVAPGAKTAIIEINHAKNLTAVVSSGLYKTAYDLGGHVTSTSAVQKSDLTSIIGNATATNGSTAATAGLMSGADKDNLDAVVATKWSKAIAVESLNANLTSSAFADLAIGGLCFVYVGDTPSGGDDGDD